MTTAYRTEFDKEFTYGKSELWYEVEVLYSTDEGLQVEEVDIKAVVGLIKDRCGHWKESKEDVALTSALREAIEDDVKEHITDYLSEAPEQSNEEFEV